MPHFLATNRKKTTSAFNTLEPAPQAMGYRLGMDGEMSICHKGLLRFGGLLHICIDGIPLLIALYPYFFVYSFATDEIGIPSNISNC